MKTLTKLAVAAVAMTSALSAAAQDRADLLFVVGDAAPGGWDLNAVTALTSRTSNVYEGTVYLQADKELKFLTKYDWGKDEYHPATADSTPDENGDVALVLNGDDTKIKLAESANYYITVDLNKMSVNFTKSAYQDAEIKYASLFMVGGATTGGWSVDSGTTLYQNQDTPYVYSRDNAEFATGTFKITTNLKGGGTWDAKYWYFAGAEDASKMALAQEGDVQWNIADAGIYSVTANTLTNDIEVKLVAENGEATSATIVKHSAPVRYYNLQGAAVSEPKAGQILIGVDAQGRSVKVRF